MLEVIGKSHLTHPTHGMYFKNNNLTYPDSSCNMMHALSYCRTYKDNGGKNNDYSVQNAHSHNQILSAV